MNKYDKAEAHYKYINSPEYIQEQDRIEKERERQKYAVVDTGNKSEEREK